MFNNRVLIFFISILCIPLSGYARESYEVIYNLNGGVWKEKFVPETIKKVNKKIEIPNEKKIKKNGYVFGGWYTTKTFELGTEVKETFSVKESKVVNLYAKWKLIDYEIVYNLNGGENDKTNPSTYNVETKSFVFAKPERIGYEFDGWYKDKNFNVENKVVEISKGSTGHVELFAKWLKLVEEIILNGDVKITLNYSSNSKISVVNGFLYNIKTKTIEKTHKNKKITLKKDKVIYSE